MTDERIKRLPKWAQQHIDKLETNLERARRMASEQWHGDDQTDTFITQSFHEGDIPLPPGSRIRFDLGDGERVEVSTRSLNNYFDRRKALEVYAAGRSHYLLFQTWSGNLGYLWTIDPAEFTSKRKEPSG